MLAIASDESSMHPKTLLFVIQVVLQRRHQIVMTVIINESEKIMIIDEVRKFCISQ